MFLLFVAPIHTLQISYRKNISQRKFNKILPDNVKNVLLFSMKIINNLKKTIEFNFYFNDCGYLRL